MIRVEFFGVPRARAGVDQLTLDLNGPSVSLRQVLDSLTRQLPGLGAEDWLHREFGRSVSANLNGERFVRALEERVQEGDSVLLLSADAGG